MSSPFLQHEVVRWLPVENVSGEEIPGFAAMRISGVNSDGTVEVSKPDTDGETDLIIFNGPVPIAIGKEGQGTNTFPIAALYNSADGTPANGEMWGVELGSWKLNSGLSGFQIIDVLSSTSATAFVTRGVTGGSTGPTLTMYGKVCPTFSTVSGTQVVTSISQERFSVTFPAGTIVSATTCVTNSTNCCVEVPVAYTCCGSGVSYPRCYSFCITVTDGGTCSPCADVSGHVRMNYTENENMYPYGSDGAGDGPGWLYEFPALGNCENPVLPFSPWAFLYCGDSGAWVLEFGGLNLPTARYELACASWVVDGPNVMTKIVENTCTFPATITVYSCATDPNPDCGTGDPVNNDCCPENPWPSTMPMTFDCPSCTGSGNFVYNPTLNRWEFTETCGSGSPTLELYLYCENYLDMFFRPVLLWICGSNIGNGQVSEWHCNPRSMVFTFSGSFSACCGAGTMTVTIT